MSEMKENMTKQTVVDNLSLLNQWNYEKNQGILPESITLGSNKKVWWVCRQGHEWQASVGHRARGRGCPFCTHEKAWPGESDLATLYPSLAKEWHPTKNGKVFPSQILPGSNLKVWWLCSKGHEWEASISNRTKGKGCPYCSGLKAWSGENDLLTLFPKLAAEWHPTKNDGILPSEVRPGSNKKVWWVCNRGHEWEDSPNHRTRGRGCPYCSHHRVTQESSLSVLFPELLNEWDYKQNIKSPNEYAAYSNERVFWKCKKCGHVWEAPIANRTNGGSGCPVCANLFIVPGLNDLITINPLLAEEWDYEKNETLPSSIGAGSTKKVWWRCAFGHSWKAAINLRNRGSGCPKCIKYLKSSIQEHVIYYYIHQKFPDAVNSYTAKELQRKEIDIYIPSRRTGIEYDGQNWHDVCERDVQKDLLCSSFGIELIRIREPECPPITRTMPTFILSDTSTIALQEALGFVFRQLGITDYKVNVADDYKQILESYRSDVVDSNFEIKYPNIAAQWHPTLNGTLRPNQLPGTASKTKVYWLCTKCNTSWRASLDSRIRGSGCPVCAGRVVKQGYNDLQSNHPSIAANWNPTKNGDLSACDVTSHSHKKVWWICALGHEWESTVKDRVEGNGCPFCSGKRVLKGYNDLATIIPWLAEEWDTQDNDKSPDQITSHSGYKAKWICKKCGYKWTAPVYSRSKGTGCPNCANERRQKHSQKKT